jgi:hypothetical protein
MLQVYWAEPKLYDCSIVPTETCPLPLFRLEICRTGFTVVGPPPGAKKKPSMPLSVEINLGFKVPFF